MSEDQAIAEWIFLRDKTVADFVRHGHTASHANMALRVLHEVLLRVCEGTPSLSQLFEKPMSMQFLGRVSQAFSDVAEQQPWQHSSAQRVFAFLRRILRSHNAPLPLLRACVLRKKNPRRNVSRAEASGAAVPRDEIEDEALRAKFSPLPLTVQHQLRTWIDGLRFETDNRSASSVRNILAFWTNTLFPAVGLELDKCDTWPKSEVGEQICAKLRSEDDLVRRIVGTSPLLFVRKLHWIKLFLKVVLQQKVDSDARVFSEELLDSLRRQRRNDLYERRSADDGRDLHRISRADLETLHRIAQKDPLNELFFLTLLTTGMRIGGFVNLRIADIAHESQEDVLLAGPTGATVVADAPSTATSYVVRSEGKTLEKGNRSFSFKIVPKVQQLLSTWLNTLRPVSTCAFVFPGRGAGEHVTTQVFRKRFATMCREAGLHGTQFHPHALRHCYAHILSEVGNPSETVARLINHTHVATTEKYYLRQSAAEICEKAIIPWLPCQDKDPVPAFLAPCAPAAATALTASQKIEQAREFLLKTHHLNKS